MDNNKKYRSRKRRLIGIFSGIGFILCTLALLYPVISDEWNRWRDSQMILTYNQENLDPSNQELAAEMLEDAREYNSDLADQVTQVITTAEYERETRYDNLLNGNGQGMMGYLEIPCIDCTEPIYHYSSDEVLREGIGHIHGSSLPVGGENTHTVLTGHRGLPGQKFLTDLDQVKVGDQFYIHVLGETYAYKVYDIRTVLPDEVDSLKIEAGKDLATLVTCTPYGINTHRLLVTGYRVPYDGGLTDNGYVTNETHHRYLDPALIVFYGFVLFILLMIIFHAVNRHRRKKKMEAADEK